MKKTAFIFIFLLLICTYSNAQTEIKKDSITLNMQEKSADEHKTIELIDDWKNVDKESPDIDIEEMKRRQEFVRRLQYPTPKIYVGPQQNTDTLGRKLPSTYEYSFANYSSLNQDIDIYTESFQKTYLLVGATRQVNASLIYDPTDWLTISGGAYAAKYVIGMRQFDDFGVTASLRFNLHDRVYLRAHGRYSVNSFDKNRNFTPAMTGMFPQTYYGGGMGFKVTENIGVEAGFTRELNPFSGKWRNTPYIMPVMWRVK